MYFVGSPPSLYTDHENKDLEAYLTDVCTKTLTQSPIFGQIKLRNLQAKKKLYLSIFLVPKYDFQKKMIKKRDFKLQCIN